MKSDNAPDPRRREDAEHALDVGRLDLNKLRTFATIASLGGVTAAASRLALSRSAVSHSLKALEDALAIPLFHRVGRGLVLTRDGERLLGAFRDAEGRIEDALAAIGDESVEARGTLRIGLYPGFSRFRLAGLLDLFLSRHPAAHCRLVHGTREELSARLRGGRLDFLLSLAPVAAGEPSGVRRTLVFEQSLVLALRSDRHPRGRGFEAIAGLPFVDYFRREPLIDRWVAHHHPRRRASTDRVRAWVGAATDVALELTRRGVGACVLPSDLVEPYRRSGELRVLRGPRTQLRDEIWLHELETPHPSALQTAFREALR